MPCSVWSFENCQFSQLAGRCFAKAAFVGGALQRAGSNLSLLRWILFSARAGADGGGGGGCASGLSAAMGPDASHASALPPRNGLLGVAHGAPGVAHCVPGVAPTTGASKLSHGRIHL